MAQYQTLAHRLLSPGTSIHGSRPGHSRSITLTDSADTVYTDFRRLRPFTVSATASIDRINDTMVACGVRLLFVTSSEGALQGLVTYTDIYGEKPVNYIQEHGGRREEILAQDLMTPLAQLEALQRADVDRSCVGDIVETLKAAGRQHMLVCVPGEDGLPVISGIFSSTQVEKTLGKKIELSSRANTFADLERALG